MLDVTVTTSTSVSKPNLPRFFRTKTWEDTSSIASALHKVIIKKKQEEARKPRSIHSSSLSTCDFLITAPFLDVQPCNTESIIGHMMAADSGEDHHNDIQTWLDEAGYLAKVIAFPEDKTLLQKDRQEMKLVAGREIALWQFLEPISVELATKYEKLGIYHLTTSEKVVSLVEEYFLSLRLDTLLRLPIHDTTGQILHYDTVICEIKSAKESYYKEIETFVTKLRDWQYKRNNGENPGNLPTVPKKLIGYIDQLQMQLHWMIDPFTPGTPRVRYGVLYVVNRNDESQTQELYFVYDERYANFWLPIVKNQNKLIKAKKLGETNPGEQCSFCPFNHANDEISVCKNPLRKAHIGNIILNKQRTKHAHYQRMLAEGFIAVN